MRNAIRVLSIIILAAVLAVGPAAAQSESQAVSDLITLARSLTQYDQRDAMLKQGASRFFETSSFLAMAGAAVYDATKNHLLALGADRARTVGDTIALAKACPAYDVRDRVLTNGERVCREPADFLMLAGAAVYDATKNNLMRRAMHITARAEDFVALAKACPAYDVRDEVLKFGATRVASVDQFVVLYGACVYDASKVTVLRAAMRDVRHIQDVIRLAKLSPQYDVRDELLLAGVRFCTSVADAQTLSGAAVYDATKNRILREFAQLAGFTALHGK